VPPAGPSRADWYIPQDLDVADGNLDWNSSILGGFDPWTKQKVTILFQSQALDLTFPGAQGMVEYDQPDGTTAKRDYPDARFSGSYPGVRLEWGNWSLAFATATGTLDWGADDVGNPRIERTKTYQAMIARGFGAWQLVDTAGDLRIGISWPELFLRVVYGEYDADPALPSVQQAIVGAGVSLLGVRATFGDLLFAEVRAGEWAYHASGAQIDLRDGTDKDVLVQSGGAFALRPTFRIGIVL
jgi:hypothetical protein